MRHRIEFSKLSYANSYVIKFFFLLLPHYFSFFFSFFTASIFYIMLSFLSVFKKYLKRKNLIHFIGFILHVFESYVSYCPSKRHTFSFLPCYITYSLLTADKSLV